MCCNVCHVAFTELSVGSTYWFSRLLPRNYKSYLSLLSGVRVLPIVFVNFLILSYGLKSSIFFHMSDTGFLTSGKPGVDMEHSIFISGSSISLDDCDVCFSQWSWGRATNMINLLRDDYSLSPCPWLIVSLHWDRRIFMLAAVLPYELTGWHSSPTGVQLGSQKQAMQCKRGAQADVFSLPWNHRMLGQGWSWDPRRSGSSFWWWGKETHKWEVSWPTLRWLAVQEP